MESCCFKRGATVQYALTLFKTKSKLFSLLVMRHIYIIKTASVYGSIRAIGSVRSAGKLFKCDLIYNNFCNIIIFKMAKHIAKLLLILAIVACLLANA